MACQKSWSIGITTRFGGLHFKATGVRPTEQLQAKIASTLFRLEWCQLLLFVVADNRPVASFGAAFWAGPSLASDAP